MGEITRRKFMEGLAAVILGVTLTPQKVFASLDEITQEEISRYMSMNTVEEILGNSVRYITPNDWDSVIQDSKKKGVLILDYRNDGKVEGDKRVAIIFKALAQKHSSEIDFIACKGDESLNKYGVTHHPSIAMYSEFDVLRGELPTNTYGKMKQLDILRSGPKKDSSINTWYQFLSTEWIPTNITSINGDYCWRFNNSWNEQKSFYKVSAR